MRRDFVNWNFQLRNKLRPQTAYSPWTNEKVEVQNKHLTNYLRLFQSSNGNDWVKFVDKFSFAHNTAVSYSNGYTPYEIMFGIKPQIQNSLRQGLLQYNKKFCISHYCQDLPSNTRCQNLCRN